MSLSLQGASGGSRAYGNFALTGLSGAATTYSTSAAPFSVSGLMYNKAAVAGGATPTTDGTSGAAMTLTANKAACWVWGINAAGTISVYKGTTVDYTDTSANSTYCPLPLIPATICPFAVVVIKAGATTVGTWTFGSSNWNATGIVVDTVKNLAGAPDFIPLTA